MIDYSLLEITWYIKNPIKGRFMIGVASERNTEICRKLEERYATRGENIYYGLRKGIEEEFGVEREKLASLIKWVLGRIGKPRSYERFFRNAEAILTFDAYEELHKIKCSTYIIAGAEDISLGSYTSSSKENSSSTGT